MILTIIPSDGAVYIDGVCFQNLMLVDIPANVHALQWKNSAGWIEFVESDSVKPNNKFIDVLPQWAVDAQRLWQDAKNTYDVAKANVEIK